MNEKTTTTSSYSVDPICITIYEHGNPVRDKIAEFSAKHQIQNEIIANKMIEKFMKRHGIKDFRRIEIDSKTNGQLIGVRKLSLKEYIIKRIGAII